MNPKAKQIHAENAERIRIERLKMAARFPVCVGPAIDKRIKIKSAVGMADPDNRVLLARRCLACGASFKSAGPSNRLCTSCRRKTEAMFGL